MTGDIKRSIGILERMRGTHIAWRDWQVAEPDAWAAECKELPREEVVGDLDHHQGCIDDYDFIIGAIRSLSKPEG